MKQAIVNAYLAIQARISNLSNPIQAYVDAPKEGRLAPQPNEDMLVTRAVKRILRLK